MLIFFLLKPLNIKQEVFDEVPALEISSFTLYELDTNSLKTIMKGSKAIRYTDKYIVSNINYTDNSKEYIAKMKANNGTYKNNIVTLHGDVTYNRKDGLSFVTQKAIYNKKTNITYIDEDFLSYQADNKFRGSALRYNNNLKTASANNITLTYQLQESNK